MVDVYSKFHEFNSHYQLFIENVNDLICIVDFNRDYKIEVINEKLFQKLLGYSNNDLIGESLLKIIHSEDKKKSVKVLKNGSKFEKIQEIRIKSKKGNYIWVEFKIKKFKDDKNQGKILLILKDVSKYRDLELKMIENEKKFNNLTRSIPEIRFWRLFNPKKYEEALQSSYSMLHVIMENIPQYIFWKDLNLRYLGSNKNYARFLEISSPEILFEQTDNDVMWNKKKAEQLREKEINIINSDKAEFHVIEPWVCKDDKKIWLDTNRIPLHDLEGKIMGILVTYDDITERTIAEQKIKKSEKKYHDLLETSSVGIIEINLKSNNISYINPKLLNILGRDRKEIIDIESLRKIIHPNDFSILLESTEEKELQFKIHQKDGKLKWLSGKRVNQYDEKGEMFSFRLWLEDVSEKKMYEKLIYDINLNFLKFSTDIQNNIMLLLNTCCKLLNGDIVLYIHRNLHEDKEEYTIITSENNVYTYNSEDFKNNLFVNELFKEKNNFTQIALNLNESKYAKTDQFISKYNIKGSYGKLIKSQNEFNSSLCVFYRENPLMSHQDKLIIFLIGDAINIEQQRWQVKQHLKEQNIMLNEINKLKTDLLSRASHELKTPLISIKGFTELLLTVHESKLDSDIISILKEIKTGSARLEKIILSLLEGAQLNQGQLNLNILKEDLTFLIKFCVNDLYGQLKLRNQSISIKIHDNLIAYIDKERIYDVVSNLITNAIKYTPPGGKITIRSKIENDFYIISIEDNGIGFTEEEKKHLFKEFGKIERYGQGWDVDAEGTGLGLFIAKKIIELHGGDIWMESEGKNKGSTFYFSLPMVSQ